MSHLRCPDNGKVGYLTEHDANRALRQAQHVRRRAYTARRYAKGREGVVGDVRRLERRAYECDCGLFHLTSQRERVDGRSARPIGYTPSTAFDGVDVSTMSDGGWEA